MPRVVEQAGGGGGLAQQHEQLLADRSLQFAFSAPPEPPRPPGWLEPLLRFLEGAAPVMKYVFWGGAALGAALIVAFVVREMLRHTWRRPAPQGQPDEAPPQWRPEPAQARALLAEADRLAAEGRFAEAAHVLLLRSIEDLRSRRPSAVRPAMTSRDIGALKDLPDSARPAFALIAEVVERSLFGGRPVDAGAFQRCRGAYHDFALGTGAAP